MFTSAYLEYKQTNSFSKIVIDYINNEEKLKNFFHYEPSLENIGKFISEKAAQNIDRKTLVNVLEKQYQNISLSAKTKENLQLLLQENTFTVCTAHQPNIFTGYLYFIYKIIHAIKLADELNLQYPKNHFVPMYYMGSEDADIAEIGTVNFRNKTYTWQPPQQGAVGEMNTDSLQTILQEITAQINTQNDTGKKLVQLLNNAYKNNQTIADATLYLVNELLGQFGLLIINPDNAELKKQFSTVIIDELLHQHSHAIVEETNKKLIEKEYKAQAQSREINLFYLSPNSRERIEKANELYKVVNTKIQFTEKEILVEVQNHPERFSPNVILRGLLQETILPNVAFIGGGGELAYWLQLKKIFQHYQIPYPPLVLRQSVLIIPKKTNEQINQLQLSNEQLFLPTTIVQKQKVLSTEHVLFLQNQEKQHSLLFDNYKQQALKFSPKMQQSIEAHQAKSKKIQERLATKYTAYLKKLEQDNMLKIEKIKTTLFPQHNLQERYDNFMDYYLEYGENLFAALYKNIDVKANHFLLLKEK